MRRSARVGINASIVGERPSGLGVYSVKLLRALDQVREDFLAYTSEPKAFGSLRARVCLAPAAVRPERGRWGHLVRLLWLQSSFRLVARTNRFKMVLNTVPEGILGAGIPQVTIVHDLVPILFPDEFPRQHYYFRFVVPQILRASRIVIAVSESTRRDVIRAYGLPAERVRVIHSGCDASAYFCNGLHDTSGRPAVPYFLYVGNLLPHKNLFRLLDALSILRRRQACRLIIRGDGKPFHTRALRERVETLGLTDAVTFAGYMSENELRGLYAGATCFLLPSLYEGFGLPVLEAMACGTPVITSTASALQEVAGDAALTVPPNDAIGLSEAMYQVLNDRELRDELCRRGLKRAAAFSWERTAEQVSRLLDEAQSAPKR